MDTIRGPLWDASQGTYASNKDFAQQYVANLLTTSFPNLRPTQVEVREGGERGLSMGVTGGGPCCALNTVHVGVHALPCCGGVLAHDGARLLSLYKPAHPILHPHPHTKSVGGGAGHAGAQGVCDVQAAPPGFPGPIKSVYGPEQRRAVLGGGLCRGTLGYGVLWSGRPFY